jgi:propionyl-CoA carboxylase alpha chain
VFGKLLIANRGEIAVRVIRTCKKMGIPTVAVYSEADIRSQYVQEADESVFIGPAPARESFLDVHKIISVAKNLHCDAVHPGYGFLSENADFASQVAQEGITFIGPPPSAIAVLGDKMASKLLAIKAGVPVVPGVHDTDSADVLREAAVEMGFPVLLKPAAGGGGRGMRIISRVEDFSSALSACKEETKKSFADDRIFLEKFISKPRHIEFQVMADGFGNVIHLGERECSIQRRYQKVIEETPSPILDATLREKMGDVACKLALAAGYVNAGTVEFILDQEKNFYFLEMNTRLQVEHPITELVTGLDLVEMQIRIAAGEQIKLRQEHVVSRGWAIESRICAEDPTRGFLPTTGMITRYAAPRGRNIRVDSGVGAGSIITIYYDSLLAKVAVWGETRLQAIQTMCKALNGYHIEGLTTNVDFCNAVINHPAFINGDLSTEFIENHFENGQSKLPPQRLHLCQMVIAAVLVHHTRQRLIKDSLKPMSPLTGISPARRKVHDYIIRSENDVFRVQTEQGISPNDWRITVDGRLYEVVAPEFEYYRRRLRLKIDSIDSMFRLQYDENHIRVAYSGITRTFEIYLPKEWKLEDYMFKGRKVSVENVLKCPMPGMITEICVAEGAQVRKGQELVRMESMKMESGIASPCDGEVESILVKPGQNVETDELLIKFKP